MASLSFGETTKEKSETFRPLCTARFYGRLLPPAHTFFSPNHSQSPFMEEFPSFPAVSQDRCVLAVSTPYAIKYLKPPSCFGFCIRSRSRLRSVFIHFFEHSPFFRLSHSHKCIEFFFPNSRGTEGLGAPLSQSDQLNCAEAFLEERVLPPGDAFYSLARSTIGFPSSSHAPPSSRRPLTRYSVFFFTLPSLG